MIDVNLREYEILVCSLINFQFRFDRFFATKREFSSEMLYFAVKDTIVFIKHFGSIGAHQCNAMSSGGFPSFDSITV